MTAAHLHLAINHIPILGSGLCFVLLLLGTLRRREGLMRASLIGLVLVALAAVPTYFSGRETEEIVEPMPEVSNAIMEEHEEAALVAMLTAEGVGLLALATLVLARGERRAPPWLRVVVLAGAAVAFGLMGWTGNLGGQVHHPEVRAPGSAS